MFPDDYDGIIAGAPANRTAISLWIADAVLKDPASYIPPAKYPMIHQAALAACDANDGLKDGLIDDPTKCDFDPKVLLCKGADGPSCLTAPQVEAAKKIYSPPSTRAPDRSCFRRFVPGTELGWGVQAPGPEPSANIYDQYRYVVFKDPNWDWKTFDFDSDVARGDQPENLVMNATDPNMKAFFSHGGKLLLYHGWSDPNVPTLNTIKYYKSVFDTMGGDGQGVEQCPAVPGARHGTLRRRRRSQRVRQSRRARAMGGTGQGAGADRSRRTAPTARWIARVRCARIRRSRSTRARAASTNRAISSAVIHQTGRNTRSTRGTKRCLLLVLLCSVPLRQW